MLFKLGLALLAVWLLGLVGCIASAISSMSFCSSA
jgi:hypothetical protein